MRPNSHPVKGEYTTLKTVEKYMDIKYKGVESDPDDFENLYSTRIMITITKLQNATFGRLTMTARMKAGRMKAAVCKVPEYRMFLKYFNQ